MTNAKWVTHWVVALLAAFLVSSCATSPRASEGAVRILLERFLRSVNASDIEAFLDCFATDATAFFPTTAARRVGIAEIRQAVQPAFALGPRNPPAHLGDLVITVDGDRSIASFDSSNGTMHSRRTLVLRRRAGAWKIVHLHASNVATV